MAKKAKVKEFDRDLPVVLTTEETAAKGLILAKHIKKRIDLGEKKRQFYAEMREKLLDLDEKIADVQNIVRTGKERRKVKCTLQMDYAENKVHVIRLDTGEVVETRAMKAEERQGELGLEEKAEERKESAA